MSTLSNPVVPHTSAMAAKPFGVPLHWPVDAKPSTTEPVWAWRGRVGGALPSVEGAELPAPAAGTHFGAVDQGAVVDLDPPCPQSVNDGAVAERSRAHVVRLHHPGQ